MPKSINILLKFIGLLFFSSILHAGPPMATDDPFTPDVGQFEINFASELIKGAETEFVTPIIDFNYGAYPNVQFTFETAYASLANEYDSTGLELALKYHFYESEALNIALYPQYLFYPISTSLDEGEEFTLIVPISLQLSANTEWILSPAYVKSKGKSSHLELGTYVKYNQDIHNYFFEFYLEEKVEENEMSTLFNVGYFYEYQEDLGLMGSVGYETIDSKKEAVVAYLGVQVLF